MERMTETRSESLFLRRELPQRILAAALGAAAAAFATDTGVSPLAPGLVCGLAMAGLYPVWALGGAALGSLLFFRWRNLVMLALYSLAQLGWGVVRSEPKRRDKLLLMALAGVMTLPIFNFASLESLFLGFSDVALALAFAVGVRLTAGAVRALKRERLVDDAQQAGLCLTLAMAVALCARFEVLSLSPAAVLAAVGALYAVQLRGAAGVGAAVVLGLARAFGGGGSMLFVAGLSACALGASALRAAGKWGVAAGFLASGAVLSLYIGGTGALSLWELVLSALPLVLLPDRYMSRLEAAVMDRPARRDRDRLMLLEASLTDASKVLRRVASLLAATAPVDGKSHRLTAAGFAGVGDLLERLAEARPSPKRRLDVRCGAAGAAKEGSRVSGDSVSVRTVMGRLLLLISDGMGSGEAARRESSETVALVGDLLAVGFEAERAMETVNSVLLMSRARETYATVDAALIDLADGECRFIKSASPPSYIVRQGRVYPMAGGALPTGILVDAAPAVHTTTLRRGDRLFLVTDGVSDALGDELLAHIAALAVEADEPQSAAERLLSEACACSRRDDMTVLAAFVE